MAQTLSERVKEFAKFFELEEGAQRESGALC